MSTTPADEAPQTQDARHADAPEDARIRAAGRDADFRRRRLERILTEDHRTVTLGMEITHLDEHAIVVEQLVGPTDVNGLGICHGGVTFTIADSATGIGANTLDEESAWVTVTSEVHFRSPARVGETLVATCVLVDAPSERRRLFETVVRTKAADGEGPVVAQVDSTMVRLREIPAPVPIPDSDAR